MALLAPRTRYLRRRDETPEGFVRSMVELHYYRPTIFRFIEAHAVTPEILVTAELDESSTVLDVGAFVGEWAQGIVERYGCTVWAFEPAPGPYAKLAGLADRDPRVHACAYGLAGESGSAVLTLAGPGSSVFAVDGGGVGRAQIELRDVVDVLDDLGLDEVDLLKVNIEGGEFALFERLIEVGALGRFRQISVQFHEWHPGAHRRRRAIRRVLRRTHEPVWDYPWVWELWRRIDDPRHTR
jgi:FkbM family methyltransferase